MCQASLGVAGWQGRDARWFSGRHLYSQRLTRPSGALAPRNDAAVSPQGVLSPTLWALPPMLGRLCPTDHVEWIDGRFDDVYTFRNGKAIQMRTFGERQEALEWAGAKASDAT